jgi:putative membrane protein
MHHVQRALAIVAISLIGAAAHADATRGSGADHDFVEKAYTINQAEVTLGHMAEERGTSPEVKAFGARMVADHTKGLDELNAAARRDGVPVPSAVSPAATQLQQHLSQLNGASFDDAYMKHMVAGHGEAVGVFTQEIANGTGPALRAYAEQMLPTLESHESAADQAQDQLRHPAEPQEQKK